jgi:diguanylate cyclase (GGDEF)-like protein
MMAAWIPLLRRIWARALKDLHRSVDGLGVILQRRHAVLPLGLALAALAASPAAAQAPSDQAAPNPIGDLVQELPIIGGGTAAPGLPSLPGRPGSGAEQPSQPAGPPAAPEPGPTTKAPPTDAGGGTGDGGQNTDGESGAEPATASDLDGRGSGDDAARKGASAPKDSAARPATGAAAAGSSVGSASGAGPAGDGGIVNQAPPEAEHGTLERIVTVVPWPVDVAIALLAGLLGLMTVRSARDRRRLAEAERLAMTDPLTGLPNRQDAELHLQRLAAVAARSGRPLAVAIVDLDHFKAINDDFGHQAGDASLRGVARALRGELRDADHVGRLGGEEFVAILPDTGTEEACAVAERIRERIAAMPRKVDRRVTASLGVAAMPDDAASVDDLMAAADRALYAAKKAGRDRVIWAGALDDAARRERHPTVPA